MNTNDLYLEYARVIKMCEGTELEDTPWVCVKLDGEALRDNYGHPRLGSAPIEKYEFAVAVLEGRPVWVGDRIYAKRPNSGMSNGAEVIRDRTGQIDFVFDTGTAFSLKAFDTSSIEKYFTWTPPAPKRTFTLNGVELPCPVKGDGHALSIDNIIFCFKNIEDAELVSKSLINLLTKARDKP